MYRRFERRCAAQSRFVFTDPQQLQKGVGDRDDRTSPGFLPPKDPRTTREKGTGKTRAKITAVADSKSLGTRPTATYPQRRAGPSFNPLLGVSFLGRKVKRPRRLIKLTELNTIEPSKRGQPTRKVGYSNKAKPPPSPRGEHLIARENAAA